MLGDSEEISTKKEVKEPKPKTVDEEDEDEEINPEDKLF